MFQNVSFLGNFYWHLTSFYWSHWTWSLTWRGRRKCKRDAEKGGSAAGVAFSRNGNVVLKSKFQPHAKFRQIGAKDIENIEPLMSINILPFYYRRRYDNRWATRRHRVGDLYSVQSGAHVLRGLRFVYITTKMRRFRVRIGHLICNQKIQVHKTS